MEERLVVFEVNPFFLEGPFLMAKLFLVDIDGYFLLLGSFEDIDHIAEKNEADPALVFLCLLGQ